MPEEQEGATEAPEKTFTQAELDAIVGDRLKRQKAQFADYDDLKTKASKFDEMAEAQKTEAQKQAEETARWQQEAETWRTRSVASTVRALAATDFADPDDAVRNVDPAKYLGVDGEVDEAAIAADLTSLLEAKPHYRRAAAASNEPRAPRPNAAQGTGERSAATDPAQQFASILSGQLKQ